MHNGTHQFGKGMAFVHLTGNDKAYGSNIKIPRADTAGSSQEDAGEAKIELGEGKKLRPYLRVRYGGNTGQRTEECQYVLRATGSR